MNLSINAERFSGKENVAVYDRYRPTPPRSLIDLTKQYVGDEIHHLVDIGCGSGLSTTAWKDEVRKITAVDPSADMLSAAQLKFKDENNFKAIQAFGHDIPLADQCSDLITCSQAFHWMDPMPTLKEFNRLLSNRGLLVVYDCIWPPSINPIWEQAFIDLFDEIKDISKNQPQPLMHFWNKAEHLANIRNSGYFSYVKQVGFHQEVMGGSDYFIGLAESQGGLNALRSIGMTDDEIGWNKFKEIIESNAISSDSKYILHYSAIFAIK